MAIITVLFRAHDDQIFPASRATRVQEYPSVIDPEI